MSKKTNRVGERFITEEHLGKYEIIIVEYNDCKNILVEFQDKHKAIVHTSYKDCRRGRVKNPYHPSVCGVGYMGVGEYNSNTKAYEEWLSMMKRCYDKKVHEINPTYSGVVVDEYFHNFQNYCKWREKNYYEVNDEIMCLDKDIRVKGSKIYSPSTCIFVPQTINNLFVNRKLHRGKELVGVGRVTGSDKYMARCNIRGKNIYLGVFNTEKEAFDKYKSVKEEYIKQIADEYKDKIPYDLYMALYSWEIEEGD